MLPLISSQKRDNMMNYNHFTDGDVSIGSPKSNRRFKHSIFQKLNNIEEMTAVGFLVKK